VRAIRLNLAGASHYAQFGEPAWLALFDRAAARGWHIETHVDAGRAPEIARALARARAGVVFDHFASPGADIEATLDAARGLARDRLVWVKLSGAYRLAGHDPRALAARWLEVLGPDRIVWGSDWPWTRHEQGRDYARIRADLDRWVGAEAARAVLWDNAARLYGFD
jgi:predicted TIM-barrel fold metal-dependent hydrolase